MGLVLLAEGTVWLGVRRVEWLQAAATHDQLGEGGCWEGGDLEALVSRWPFPPRKHLRAVRDICGAVSGQIRPWPPV